MVRDGLYYGAALATTGTLVSYLTQPWFGLPLFILAAFCLYFFRDPERQIPGGPVAVAPADGKIVAVRPEGVNEQNTVEVEGNGTRVVFKQIAGLIARRIVCNKKPGDKVLTGERIGLIKFGSRVDVVFGPEWDLLVHEGMRVVAGSTVLARRNDVERTSDVSAQVSTLEPVTCRG